MIYSKKQAAVLIRISCNKNNRLQRDYFYFAPRMGRVQNSGLGKYREKS